MTSLPDGATTLDLTEPVHNLYAFAKTWSSLDDTHALSCFHGTMSAWLPGRRLQPLFGFTGTGLTQCRFVAPNRLQLRGKETGFFTDLETGEMLRTWDNPFTGETVEVFDFVNERICGELTDEMPVLVVGDHHDEGARMNETVPSDGTQPFVLPWQRYGDEVLLEWDYAHCYPNPVDPARWPRASTGTTINPSEHFTIFTSWRELSDLDSGNAHFRAGFSRLSPWWPWMRMGADERPDHPAPGGVLFGRMFSRSCPRGLDDLPHPLRAHVEAHHPSALEPRTDWELAPILSTWEAFAQSVPAEVVT